MDEIKVKFVTTIDNYLKFNIFTLNKYHNLQTQYLILVIVGCLFFILSYFLELGYLLILCGIISLLVRILYPINLKRKITKIVQESPTLLTSGEITFNKDEIVEITDRSTMRVKWSDLYSLDDDGHLLYIFFTKVQAFIIDKKHLSDQEIHQIRCWKNG